MNRSAGPRGTPVTGRGADLLREIGPAWGVGMIVLIAALMILLSLLG